MRVPFHRAPTILSPSHSITILSPRWGFRSPKRMQGSENGVDISGQIPYLSSRFSTEATVRFLSNISKKINWVDELLLKGFSPDFLSVEKYPGNNASVRLFFLPDSEHVSGLRTGNAAKLAFVNFERTAVCEKQSVKQIAGHHFFDFCVCHNV